VNSARIGSGGTGQARVPTDPRLARRVVDVSQRFRFVLIAGWVGVSVILWLALGLTPTVDMSQPTPLPGDVRPMIAAASIDRNFTGREPNTLVYVVIDSDHLLGATDRDYYESVVRRLRSVPNFVVSVLDMWSDPLTAPIAESPDQRSSYALVWLDGELGGATTHAAVDATRALVESVPHPRGTRAYLAGPGTAFSAPRSAVPAAELTVVAATLAILAALVLVAFRPRLRAAIALLAAAMTMLVAAPLIALLHAIHVVTLSTLSAELAAVLTAGAAIDFTLALTGLYREQRRRGADTATALGSAYTQSVPRVVIPGIASALVLSATVLGRIPLLRGVGMPAAIGMVLAMLAVLTLAPALVSLTGQRSSWLQSPPTRSRWLRRVDIAAIRRPRPFVAAGIAVAVLAIAAVVGLRTDIDPDRYLGAASSSSGGHFPGGRLLPEIVMIQSDHDLRDPDALIAIDRVTRRILDLPGVRRVQSASWPAGIPWPEATFTFQAGELGKQLQRQAASITSQLAAVKSLSTSLDMLSNAVDQLEGSMAAGVAGLREVGHAADGITAGVQNIRDTTMSVSDYLRPIRQWVDGTPNCPGDMLCAAALKLVGPFDRVVRGVNDLTNGAERMLSGSHNAADAFALGPQAVAQMRSALNQLQGFMSGLVKTIDSALPQVVELTVSLKNVSLDFRSSGEGGFYLPRKALNDRSYQRVKESLFSADGRATRLFVYGDTDDARLPPHARPAAITGAVEGATKYGALANSTVSVTGVGSFAQAMCSLTLHDFAVLFVAVVAVALIAGVVLNRLGMGLVGLLTVLISFGLALGVVVAMSWYACGVEIDWSATVLAFTVICALGIPYHLGVVAHCRQAGDGAINTGLVRASRGMSGLVGCATGIVFGTALVLLTPRATVAGQVGAMIAIGLLANAIGAHTCTRAAWSLLGQRMTTRAKR
jgi:putative drug exporter of the RND superfamily